MTAKTHSTSLYKKLLSAICAVCTVFALAVPAFADAAVQVQVDSTSSINNVAGGVSFIERATDLDSLAARFDGEVYPSAIVFTVDSALNVKTESGEDLGYTLAEGLDATNGWARPVIEVSDRETVEAVCEVLAGAQYLDFLIMSESAPLLRYAHELYDWSCGVLDRSDLDAVPTEDELATILGDAASSYSNVVLFSQDAVSAESIRYLFVRTVLTWTKDTRTLTDTDALRDILSGTFGIISNETDRLYRAATEMIAPNTLTRVPVNISHRGSLYHAPENTIEAIQKAMDEGADAVEIDIHTTLDKKVILSHDDYALSKSDYLIYERTLEDIQALDANEGRFPEYGVVRIPTFEEMLQAFADTDLVIYVEIKDWQEMTVPEACRLIKEYGYTDRVVFIAFNTIQLSQAKELVPEVPASLLVGITPQMGDPSWLASELIAPARPFGLTTDANYLGGNSPELAAEAYAHGFNILLWTLNDSTTIYTFYTGGYLSLTTNVPYEFDGFSMGAYPALDADTFETGTTYHAAGDPHNVRGDILKASRRVLILPDDDGAVISEKDSAVTFTTPGEHTYFEGFIFRGSPDYAVYAERTVSVTEACVPGDVNADGAVNAKDVAFILKHLAGYSIDLDEKAADVNADGTVNAKDVTVILRQLAGY